MLSKSRLIVLALAQLTLIAAMQPVDAKPMITGKPFKIHPDTAKQSCAIMDGTFRYASGGGFTCTIYGSEVKLVQTCNAKGSCTSTREPYGKP